MREGWELVTLKDVCSKGSSNITQRSINDNEGQYSIYGASGLIKKVDFYQQEKPYIGIVKDGSIYTADKNVLKGITMSVVEDIANENNIAFKRMPITQSMFNSADAVFITSSSGGVTPTTVVGNITNLLVSKYKDKKVEYGTLL